MIYGHQQEAAAEALRQLLTTDTLPADALPPTPLTELDWSPCETSSAWRSWTGFTAIAQGNLAVDDPLKTERGMLSTLEYRGLQHLACITADTPRPQSTIAASPVDAPRPTGGAPERRAVAPGGRRDQRVQPRPRRRHPPGHHRGRVLASAECAVLADVFDLHLDALSAEARGRLWQRVLQAHRRWQASQL